MSALPKGITIKTHERGYQRCDDRFLKRTLAPDEYKLDYYGQLYVPYDSQKRLENEVASLRFIRSKTNIPVPNVLDAYEHEGSFYLWTELVTGIEMSKLSPSDQATVMVEVEDHIRTLQNLRSQTIGGPSGIICPPHHVAIKFDRQQNWVSKSSSTDEFVFCHNDLSQHNIIVDPEILKIAAIIDWEYAGYWPAFFETPFFRDPRPSGAQARDLTNTARLVDFLSARMHAIIMGRQIEANSLQAKRLCGE